MKNFFKIVLLLIIFIIVFILIRGSFLGVREGYSERRDPGEVGNYGYFPYEDLMNPIGHFYYDDRIFGGYPYVKYLHQYNPNNKYYSIMQ